MDPPLAKAKPISDRDSTSVITYLRGKDKKTCGEKAVEKGVRRCERNNSADTKVSEEGGGRRCSTCQSRDSSLSARDEDQSEAGCCPAVHGGPWWSRCPPVGHGRNPTPEQVDA